MFYPAVDLVLSYAHHFEYQQAVVQQQQVARFDIAREFLVIDADPLLIAEFAVRVENKCVASLQRNFVLGKLADANLWALQVRKYADLPAVPGRNLANQFGAILVVFDSTVRKIHAHHIHACRNQPVEDFRR